MMLRGHSESSKLAEVSRMNTVAEVMAELEKLGSEQTRKTFARHGAPVDQMFGVKWVT